MRRLLFVLGILSIIIGCKSNNAKDNIDDKDKRNEHWVWWIDDNTNIGKWIQASDETTVKNGHYICFYNNGNIYQRGKIKDGKNIDTVYVYGLNNDVVCYKVFNGEKMFNHRVKNGPFKIYYQNGNIWQEGITENDVIKNKYVEYYTNGNIKYKYINTDENKNGELIVYNLDGKIRDKALGEFSNTKSFFFDSTISNDKFFVYNGTFTGYYENGNRKNSFNIVSGVPEGEYKCWYENGNIKTLGDMRKGIANGSIIGYHKNGKLKFTGHAQDNKQDGKFLLYDSTGRFFKEITFKNGVEVK